MTLSLHSSLLLGCTALLLLATAAQAQVVRPSNTLYLALKGGATAYGGELDRTGDYYENTGQTDANTSDTAWLTRDLGWAAGAEIGYLFTEHLGLGLGFQYGVYKNLDEDFFNFTTGATGQINDTEALPTATAALRYMPWPSSRIAPFVNMGAQATFGNGDRAMGLGPLMGVGLDFMLSPQLSVLLEGNGSFIFNDAAVDFSDPGANTGATRPGAVAGDDADYDNLVLYGLGLKYAFNPPYTPVAITGLECPAELTAGEAGSFMVMTNADATPPVNAMWTWGDGSAGSTGMSTSHRFSTPGTYTVTATARGDYNEVMESCLVTVVEPQIPPVLSACRVSPSTVNPGETVTLNGSVNRDASMPVSIAVTWGDGDGDSGTTFPSTHSYSEPGTYTVTATATNAYGSDTCTTTVTVGDSFCADVAELNSVYFGFGASTLTAEAIELLDENLEILRRCPDICALIRAYTDGVEAPNDAIRLSQARANAIRDYYVANGIDMSRLRAEGLGVDPNANPKESVGRGDNRARRGDSIPASCGTFVPRR